MLLGIIGIFGLLVSIGIVLQYFTFFNRFEQIAFISYLLLPLAAIGLDLYRYRLLFTVFAIVISSLLLYFSYEFNSREYRSELEKSLADALERVSPGNEIDFAEDYDTAISRIRETPYDIAFCDIQMPGKNGLDLTGSPCISTANGERRYWPISSACAALPPAGTRSAAIFSNIRKPRIR